MRLSDISHCRIRIFLDYWNFELSMRAMDNKFNTDWEKIGPVLVQATSEVIQTSQPVEFQGLKFYGSYGHTEQGYKRKEWVNKLVAMLPGVTAHMFARHRKKNYPECPRCNAKVKACPKCRADMRGTQEKGVDVRIATDMITLAWADDYDVAVLVSSDADFVPVAEFLETRGIKVIHGSFPGQGHHLSSRCWARIDLFQLRNKFRFQK